LSAQYPPIGMVQAPVSPPEYLELRQLSRSFSVVGAYATDEVNLTAGDRALSVRAAYVDEHLLKALGVQPVRGRVFGTGETDVNCSPSSPGQAATPLPSLVILSHEMWQTAFAGRPIVGRMLDVNGRPR